MFIEFCKSKIAYATVTELDLYYEGSITISEDLVEAVDLIAGEKVQVLNLNNGTRFDTYVIVGKPKTGQICLNGPAARLGIVGDQVIILSYGVVQQDEARKMKTKVIHLDAHNQIKN
jgi:aspartate 1-decarboxylase